MPTKYNKKDKRERLDMEGLPPSFFQSGSDILNEDRGISKLRHRNDKIHAELQDLSSQYQGSKLSVYKVENGNFIIYHIRGLDISVKLINQ